MEKFQSITMRPNVPSEAFAWENWQVIDTINGAKTSAMIYSIVETALANKLKPYEYFMYLLEEIPEHMEEC